MVEEVEGEEVKPREREALRVQEVRVLVGATWKASCGVVSLIS